MEDRMRIRLEKLIKKLLKDRYSRLPFLVKRALRADGVTDGWMINFRWNLNAADLDLMIIPEKQDDDEIRDQIKAEIDRMLPSWKKLESP